MGLKLEVGKYYKTRDGRKVGPMKNSYHTAGYYCWHTISGNCNSNLWNEDGCSGSACEADLISEWPVAPTGPVRTVTKREIVYGVHGDIEVVEDDTHQGGIGIYINATMNAARIRAAANSMLAVADALEDN